MRWNKNTFSLHAVIGGAGKTCAAHLLRNVLERGVGRRCGLITTRHTYLEDRILPPPAWPEWRQQLDNQLQEMCRAGCQDVILTLPPFVPGSQALEGLAFETVILIGGTPEDPELLVRFLKELRGCLICNLDDPDLRALIREWDRPVLTYAERRSEADLNARNLCLRADRIEFEALTDEAICRMRLPVPGGFGLYNAMAALAFGLSQGLRLDRMAGVLSEAEGVRGRMELLSVPASFDVMIDSAATPEQIDNLLMTARGLADGRLILVLGAPGDRDRSRRPQLGEAASRADLVILTEDDPRTESAEEICRQIRSGMDRCQSEMVTERRAAIDRALDLARPGDLVLLSGRGDKTCMLVREGSVPLDERAVVCDYFRRRSDRKRKDA